MSFSFTTADVSELHRLAIALILIVDEMSMGMNVATMEVNVQPPGTDCVSELVASSFAECMDDFHKKYSQASNTLAQYARNLALSADAYDAAEASNIQAIDRIG